ncbi:MAG TPA: hypothetical protein EYG79_14735 [Rhodobacteraceae bacterium]|nr:hypothetical protein [Paracoccaceae bacterium]
MPKPSFLNRFISWSQHELVEKYSNAKRVVCEPTLNSAVYVRIDTSEIVSQVTVWENGSYTIEFAEVAKPENIHTEEGSGLQPEDFTSKFAGLVEFLDNHH